LAARMPFTLDVVMVIMGPSYIRPVDSANRSFDRNLPLPAHTRPT